MSPAEALACLLIKNNYGMKPSVGASVNWPVFISSLPEKGNEAICVYDTGGTSDGRLMSGETIIHPGVQIRIRSSRYAAGWDKGEAIGRFLDTIFRQAVVDLQNVTWVVVGVHRRPLLALGREPEGTRQNFTLNATLTWSNNSTPLDAQNPVYASNYLELSP